MNGAIEGWLDWMIGASWQVALLIGLVALAALASRRLPAQVRYALWLLVIVKLFTPPGLAAPWSVGHWGIDPLRGRSWRILAPPQWPEVDPARSINSQQGFGSPTVFAPSELPPPNAESTGFTRPDFVAAIFSLWLAGFLVTVGLILWRATRLRSWIAEAQCVDEGPLRIELERLALQLGKGAPPPLVLSGKVNSPLLFGLFRPVIVLPSELSSTLSDEEMTGILLHELVHWRRGDLVVGWAQAFAQAVFWFHPLVWIAGAQIRHERECACDEEALGRADCEPKSYGESILKVIMAAQGRSPVSLGMLGIFERGTRLQQRLESIMRYDKTSRSLGTVGWLGLAAFAFIFFPMAAVRSSAQQGDLQGSGGQVHLVIGVDELTFEGKSTNWEQLPTLINGVVDRGEKVLAYAVADADIPYADFDSAQRRLFRLREWYQLRGLSYTGTKQLGWRGDVAAATAPAPTDAPAPAPRPQSAPAPRPQSVPAPIAAFVRVVLGVGAMTFEGESTTIDTLRERLAALPDLENTVLEYAIDPLAYQQMSLAEVQAVTYRLMGWTGELGFRYFSRVGQHPLGSRRERDIEVAQAPGPPRLIAVIPRTSQDDVDPAIKEITLTFNQDMRGGMSWTGGGTVFPKISEGMRPFWRDKRTCVLPVELLRGKFYRFGVNSTGHHNFQNSKGKPVDPVVVYFMTKGASAEEREKMTKPKIVKLDPANGADAVAVSTSRISATFNVPMGGGISWTGGGATFPAFAKGSKPTWSADKMTSTLTVVLKPAWDYVLGLNSPSFNNFQSQWGVPLDPVLYKFKTEAE